MPKMIISLEGVVIREVQLTKDITTLGRRPYNDVVLDNPAVSGEHAVIELKGREVHLQDLQSTNGTFVNGAQITRSLVQGGDIVELARYQIQFVTQSATPATGSREATEPVAFLKVVRPAGHDRPVPLVKAVTTFGKPGLVVAAITQRGPAFMLSRVEGIEALVLNGQSMSLDEPVLLKNQDIFELAGTTLQFCLS